MGLRLSLQAILETLLGSQNVYFQPPPTMSIEYPCIIYKRDNAQTRFAGDKPYSYTKKYTVTYIDRNPDSIVPDKIAKLRRCVHNRSFTADNLNHDVFTLFF